MPIEPLFATLLELVIGLHPPPDAVAVLADVYRSMLTAYDVDDDSPTRERLAWIVGALADRRREQARIEPMALALLTEVFPVVAEVSPATFHDEGEWARLSLPNGWYVHLSREGDLVRIGSDG